MHSCPCGKIVLPSTKTLPRKYHTSLTAAICALSDFRECAFACLDSKELFPPPPPAASSSSHFLTQFNCVNIWVPSRASAAAEPSTSGLSVAEEPRGLRVAPSAAETPALSGDHSKEVVKESSGPGDISEGTELNHIWQGSDAPLYCRARVQF